MQISASPVHTAAATEKNCRTDFSSFLPQYWAISTTAPLPRPFKAAVTKVLIALAWDTGARAFWA